MDITQKVLEKEIDITQTVVERKQHISQKVLLATSLGLTASHYAVRRRRQCQKEKEKVPSRRSV